MLSLAQHRAGMRTAALWLALSTAPVWALTTPVAQGPTNGALLKPGTVEFRWSASTDATSYRLQVATSANFVTTNNDKDCSNCVLNATTTTTYTGWLKAQRGTTYYWRVRGGAVAQSAWSTTASFRINSLPEIRNASVQADASGNLAVRFDIADADPGDSLGASIELHSSNGLIATLDTSALGQGGARTITRSYTQATLAQHLGSAAGEYRIKMVAYDKLDETAAQWGTFNYLPPSSGGGTPPTSGGTTTANHKPQLFNDSARLQSDGSLRVSFDVYDEDVASGDSIGASIELWQNGRHVATLDTDALGRAGNRTISRTYSASALASFLGSSQGTYTVKMVAYDRQSETASRESSFYYAGQGSTTGPGSTVGSSGSLNINNLALGPNTGFLPSSARWVGAVASPTNGDSWRNGENRQVTWDAAILGGGQVALFVLHDDPQGIADDNPSISILNSRRWHLFAKEANRGTLSIDPQILGGTGNAYKVLVLSDNGNFIVSRGRFNLNYSGTMPTGGEPPTTGVFNCPVSYPRPDEELKPIRISLRKDAQYLHWKADYSAPVNRDSIGCSTSSNGVMNNGPTLFIFGLNGLMSGQRVESRVWAWPDGSRFSTANFGVLGASAVVSQREVNGYIPLLALSEKGYLIPSDLSVVQFAFDHYVDGLNANGRPPCQSGSCWISKESFRRINALTDQWQVIYDVADSSNPTPPTTQLLPAPEITVSPGWEVPVGAPFRLTLSQVPGADEYRIYSGTSPGRYGSMPLLYTAPIELPAMSDGVDLYITAAAAAKGKEGARTPEKRLIAISPEQVQLEQVPLAAVGDPCFVHRDSAGQYVVPLVKVLDSDGGVLLRKSTFREVASGSDSGRVWRFVSNQRTELNSSCDGALLADDDTLVAPLVDGSWIGLDWLRDQGDRYGFVVSFVGSGAGLAQRTPKSAGNKSLNVLMCPIAATCSHALYNAMADYLYGRYANSKSSVVVDFDSMVASIQGACAIPLQTALGVARVSPPSLADFVRVNLEGLRANGFAKIIAGAEKLAAKGAGKSVFVNKIKKEIRPIVANSGWEKAVSSAACSVDGLLPANTWTEEELRAVGVLIRRMFIDSSGGYYFTQRWEANDLLGKVKDMSTVGQFLADLYQGKIPYAEKWTGLPFEDLARIGSEYNEGLLYIERAASDRLAVLQQQIDQGNWRHAYAQGRLFADDLLPADRIGYVESEIKKVFQDMAGQKRVAKKVEVAKIGGRMLGAVGVAGDSIAIGKFFYEWVVDGKPSESASADFFLTFVPFAPMLSLADVIFDIGNDNRNLIAKWYEIAQNSHDGAKQLTARFVATVTPETSSSEVDVVIAKLREKREDINAQLGEVEKMVHGYGTSVVGGAAVCTAYGFCDAMFRARKELKIALAWVDNAISELPRTVGALKLAQIATALVMEANNLNALMSLPKVPLASSRLAN